MTCGNIQAKGEVMLERRWDSSRGRPVLQEELEDKEDDNRWSRPGFRKGPSACQIF